MTKRKGIRPGVRFNVFNRDRFTCQYCGRTPPDVVLELEHVVPVAAGGSNKESNLLTACETCNSGKSTKAVADMPESIALQLEQRSEHAEQIKAYRLRASQIREAEDALIDWLQTDWFRRQVEDDPDSCRFTEARRHCLRTFFQRLHWATVYDQVVIAHNDARMSYNKLDSEPKVFQRFCERCWDRIDTIDMQCPRPLN